LAVGMEWPEYTLISSLFPSFNNTKIGPNPHFIDGEPVWNILDPDSKNSLKSQLLDLVNSRHERNQKNHRRGITIDETKGPVVVEDSANIEESAHLIGPCYVGENAQIRHGAYIRENSWICSDAVVGHCSEIKHSILLPGAKAPHFNYVGDSILGKGVNLGAGVKLSNLRNDGTEVFLKIDGTRVPSGLRKFGAVLGENTQLGCNSVTNPGVILGTNSVVWPNTTVTGVHPEQSIHR
jgi:NDP-sugar pyrophosphorylase family protein